MTPRVEAELAVNARRLNWIARAIRAVCQRFTAQAAHNVGAGRRDLMGQKYPDER